MNIVIYEDELYENFYPITATRPVWDLRYGCFLMHERIRRDLERLFPGETVHEVYYTRDHLKDYYSQRYPSFSINSPLVKKPNTQCVLINARVLCGKKISSCGINHAYTKHGIPLITRIDHTLFDHIVWDNTETLARSLQSSPLIRKTEDISIEALDFIWNMTDQNEQRIRDDYAIIKGQRPQLPESVTVIGDPDLLYIENNVRINPFVCFDVTDGPIIVKGGTIINSFTRIMGPCSIGEDCQILGVKVREGCSIGDGCRIGGEIEDSIFQGHVNKYHEGFIGHAYIGEWVNLGALTTNSDLKNNYEPVKSYLPGGRQQTGLLKVGCFIGDFTKTSIGTLISTGASIGPGCMLVHDGQLSPAHIPPFTWYINRELCDRWTLDSFITSCKTITARRNVIMSDQHQQLIKTVYRISQAIRQEELQKWKKRAK